MGLAGRGLRGGARLRASPCAARSCDSAWPPHFELVSTPPPRSPPLRSCDDVWLPHFEFVNARGFSQDRIVRYGVRFRDDTDGVAWWAHVQGEWVGGARGGGARRVMLALTGPRATPRHDRRFLHAPPIPRISL